MTDAETKTVEAAFTAVSNSLTAAQTFAVSGDKKLAKAQLGITKELMARAVKACA